LGVCLVAFAACKPQKSLRQIYEETYEVNLQACVDVMVKSGYEAEAARRICDCSLKAAFELDSTYVVMNPTTRDAFFNEHRALIIERCEECDSIPGL
jgi:hypothetical protein